MRNFGLEGAFPAATGCAALLERVEPPRGMMTVCQARASLLKSLQQFSHIASPRELTFTWSRIANTGNLSVTEIDRRSAPCEFAFSLDAESAETAQEKRPLCHDKAAN